MKPADGTAAGATAYAQIQVKNETAGWYAQCLRFVRSSAGAPGLGGSARTAWAAAKYKHKGDRNPPSGVPVFFGGGRFGHVVVSKLEGAVYSTDSHVVGQVRSCSISHIESKWHMKYLGWTEDVNNVRLKNIGLPRVTFDTLINRIAKKNKYVGIQSIAFALRGRGYSGFIDNSSWGPGKQAAYKKWQQKLGYVGAAADGIPGRASLIKLGETPGHKFSVR